MPVQAVIFAGRSRVSSGSAMTTFGSISGWKMIFLVWSARIGDHAGTADLGSGPGGGRHRDDRRDPLRVGARPPILAVLEIEDRPRLAGHEGDDLADIHARAAAKGDHAIVPAQPVCGEPVVEVLQGRIAIDLREDGDRNARPLEDVDRLWRRSAG